MKFNILSMFFLLQIGTQPNYKMAPHELQNGAQGAEKWCPMLFQHFCYQVT